MCRVFGCVAAEPVSIRHELLEAENPLIRQSVEHDSGWGMAVYERADGGEPDVLRFPQAAHVDGYFRDATDRRGRIFNVHVRRATMGGLTLENTHPFVLDGRVFGHNGVVGDLGRLEAELGDVRSELLGTTDSERLFAFITRRIRDAGGDVRAGIVGAVRHLAAAHELYSLNFVLTTADEVWALRYPEHNELWLLDRRPSDGDELLDERGSFGEIHVASPEAAEQRVVLVASEQMDGDPRWTPIAPGELVHVDADLRITREVVLPDPPAHPMELTGRAAASQTESLSS